MALVRKWKVYIWWLSVSSINEALLIFVQKVYIAFHRRAWPTLLCTETRSLGFGQTRSNNDLQSNHVLPGTTQLPRQMTSLC